MSARYNDAGSGPHDGAAREDGNINCGCKHDGLRWIEFCDAARRGWQATHARAALEHANSQWDEVQK